MNKIFPFLILLFFPSVANADRVLYYFSTKSCVNCPTFKQALLDPENVKLIKQYDKAYSLVKEDLPKKTWDYYTKLYNVTGVPTLIIVDTEKKSEENPGGALTRQIGNAIIYENGVKVNRTKEILRAILGKFIPKKEQLFRIRKVK